MSKEGGVGALARRLRVLRDSASLRALEVMCRTFLFPHVIVYSPHGPELSLLRSKVKRVVVPLVPQVPLTVHDGFRCCQVSSGKKRTVGGVGGVKKQKRE